MKIRLYSFILAFFLLAASAFASKWIISSFDDSPEPGEPDTYISAEVGGGLKPVSPSQVTAQPGRIYVRQKFEDAFGDEEPSYQIFQGRANEATKTLGKISLEGIPYTTLLKMKLFYARNSSGDDDLEAVYFDGKDIFVEGEDPVYINLNGRMEELKPIVSKEYKISITSTPVGATVSVGNTERGQTPVTFSVPSSKPITVVVSMDGYYTLIQPVTPIDSRTAQEGVNLVERPPLENPAVAYRASLQTAVENKDAAAARKLKTDIQQTINGFTASTKKSVDGIMAGFPANPQKTASESASDFSGRQSVWTNTQSRERDALNKIAQEHFKELKDLLAEVDAATGEMDFGLKYEYIPNSAIEFLNLGIKDLTLSVGLENSRISFDYEKAKLSYGNLSRNELVQGQEKVHGVLKVWNSSDESGNFNSIYDIAFFYDETPLKMLTKGTFTVDGATPASRNIERDLNSRIAKYPRKADWDKRDGVATLAALRAGEIKDAPAAAPVQEAYYDEDEDDEEFDDEMEEQERYDYARYGAVSSATDIFGNTDEYLFWAGVAFAAAAIGTGVVGFLQNKTYNDADKAIKAAQEQINRYEDQIASGCRTAENQAQCVAVITEIAKNSPDSMQPSLSEYDSDLGRFGGSIYLLQKNIDANKKVKDSYNTGRIIWFSAAAVSLGISITFFAW